MAAYTPGLTISSNVRIRKLRELPLRGKVLVGEGDVVSATTPVLSAELPGDLEILRVADRLGFDAEDLSDKIKISVGDEVSEGEVLAEIKSFFGFFTSQLKSPMDGVVEFFVESNAHLGIRREATPFSVDAYIQGRVVDIEESKSVTIEASAAVVQGIFGVGGERKGKVFCVEIGDDQEVSVSYLQSVEDQLRGALLVGGSFYSSEALKFAANSGVSAIITGSIDPEALRDYVGKEIGLSATGDEDVGAVLIVTEGFGRLSMSPRIREVVQPLSGMFGSVNGTTQVRAGAMRPELIVSLEEDGNSSQEFSGGVLEIGSKVRLIRVPYFGEFATVVKLPSQATQIKTGAYVRVAEVKLASGEEVIVPRANLEICV